MKQVYELLQTKAAGVRHIEKHDGDSSHVIVNRLLVHAFFAGGL